VLFCKRMRQPHSRDLHFQNMWYASWGKLFASCLRKPTWLPWAREPTEARNFLNLFWGILIMGDNIISFHIIS
jgi:hypothetical protein